MVLLTASRTARDVHEFYEKAATAGASVGPGSYSAAGQEPAVTAPGGALGIYVRPDITKWHTKLVTPGPGAYDLRRATSEPSMERTGRTGPVGSGASPFRSRQTRISVDNLKEPMLVPGSRGFLPCSITENPGPGQYEMPPTFTRSGQSFSRSPNDNLPAVSHQTPASFPPIREPARHTGRSEDSSGPGDYSREDAHSAMHTVMGRSASSINFHASASERMLWPKPCSIEHMRSMPGNPGPGAYEANVDAATGLSSPFVSSTDRMATSQPFESASCSTSLTPGPGAYSMESQSMSRDSLEGHSTSKDPSKQDRKNASYGLRSDSAREGMFRPALTQPFTDPDHHKLFPGPGQYSSPPSSFKGERACRARTMSGVDLKFPGVHTPQHLTSLRETAASRTTGFSSAEPRDCLSPERAQAVTAPTDYNRNEAMGQSISSDMKEAAKLAQSGAFGTTVGRDRFDGFTLDSRLETPDPGQYRETSSLVSPQAQEVSAFRSRLPRFSHDPGVSDNHARPGPGTYELTSDQELAPRQTGASRFRFRRTDHLSFGSGRNRFDEREYVLNGNPGPGEYNGHARKHRVTGSAMKSTAKRSLAPSTAAAAEKAQDGLDPGTYNVVGTMVKRTLNMSNDKAALQMQAAARGGAR